MLLKPTESKKITQYLIQEKFSELEDYCQKKNLNSLDHWYEVFHLATYALSDTALSFIWEKIPNEHKRQALEHVDELDIGAYWHLISWADEKWAKRLVEYLPVEKWHYDDQMGSSAILWAAKNANWSMVEQLYKKYPESILHVDSKDSMELLRYLLRPSFLHRQTKSALTWTAPHKELLSSVLSHPEVLSDKHQHASYKKYPLLIDASESAESLTILWNKIKDSEDLLELHLRSLRSNLDIASSLFIRGHESVALEVVQKMVARKDREVSDWSVHEEEEFKTVIAMALKYGSLRGAKTVMKMIPLKQTLEEYGGSALIKAALGTSGEQEEKLDFLEKNIGMDVLLRHTDTESSVFAYALQFASLEACKWIEKKYPSVLYQIHSSDVVGLLESAARSSVQMEQKLEWLLECGVKMHSLKDNLWERIVKEEQSAPNITYYRKTAGGTQRLSIHNAYLWEPVVPQGKEFLVLPKKEVEEDIFSMGGVNKKKQLAVQRPAFFPFLFAFDLPKAQQWYLKRVQAGAAVIEKEDLRAAWFASVQNSGALERLKVLKGVMERNSLPVWSHDNKKIAHFNLSLKKGEALGLPHWSLKEWLADYILQAMEVGPKNKENVRIADPKKIEDLLFLDVESGAPVKSFFHKSSLSAQQLLERFVLKMEPSGMGQLEGVLFAHILVKMHEDNCSAHMREQILQQMPIIAAQSAIGSPWRLLQEQEGEPQREAYLGLLDEQVAFESLQLLEQLKAPSAWIGGSVVLDKSSGGWVKNRIKEVESKKSKATLCVLEKILESQPFEKERILEFVEHFDIPTGGAELIVRCLERLGQEKRKAKMNIVQQDSLENQRQFFFELIEKNPKVYLKFLESHWIAKELLPTIENMANFQSVFAVLKGWELKGVPTEKEFVVKGLSQLLLKSKGKSTNFSALCLEQLETFSENKEESILEQLLFLSKSTPRERIDTSSNILKKSAQLLDALGEGSLEQHYENTKNEILNGKDVVSVSAICSSEYSLFPLKDSWGEEAVIDVVSEALQQGNFTMGIQFIEKLSVPVSEFFAPKWFSGWLFQMGKVMSGHNQIFEPKYQEKIENNKWEQLFFEKKKTIEPTFDSHVKKDGEKSGSSRLESSVSVLSFDETFDFFSTSSSAQGSKEAASWSTFVSHPKIPAFIEKMSYASVQNVLHKLEKTPIERWNPEQKEALPFFQSALLWHAVKLQLEQIQKSPLKMVLESAVLKNQCVAHCIVNHVNSSGSWFRGNRQDGLFLLVLSKALDLVDLSQGVEVRGYLEKGIDKKGVKKEEIKAVPLPFVALPEKRFSAESQEHKALGSLYESKFNEELVFSKESASSNSTMRPFLPSWFLSLLEQKELESMLDGGSGKPKQGRRL